MGRPLTVKFYFVATRLGGEAEHLGNLEGGEVMTPCLQAHGLSQKKP